MDDTREANYDFAHEIDTVVSTVHEMHVHTARRNDHAINLEAQLAKLGARPKSNLRRGRPYHHNCKI